MLLLCGGSVFADPVVFEAQTTEGSPCTGALTSLDSKWHLTLEEKKLTDMQWLTLRQKKKPLPSFPTGPQFVLHNGNRIPFDPKTLRMKGESFLIESGLAEKSLSVPLAATSILWLRRPAQVRAMEPYLRGQLTKKRATDQIILENGDSLEGILSGLTDRSIVLEADNKPMTLERSKVAVVLLSGEFAMNLQPKGVSALATLANGTRLSLTQAECQNGNAIVAKTAFGATVGITQESLLSLDLYSASAVYLSDLKPEIYKHKPYLNLSWPLGMDSTTSGHSLKLGKSTYSKGLGMHSACEVTWAVPPGAKRFEAVVGLDAVFGQKGSARIGVLLDGKKVDPGWKKELTARTAPVAVKVPLSKATRLTLIVDYGLRGDIADHVNWVDARLVK